jgi:hypothetical protein
MAVFYSFTSSPPTHNGAYAATTRPNDSLRNELLRARREQDEMIDGAGNVKDHHGGSLRLHFPGDYRTLEAMSAHPPAHQEEITHYLADSNCRALAAA